MYNECASYLSAAFDNPTVIEDRFLNSVDVPFDTIIGTGLSGCLIVPILARSLNVNWAIVRKDDSSHSVNMVEGKVGDSWIFVDDLIETGNTLKRCIKLVNDLEIESGYDVERGIWVKGKHITSFIGAFTYARKSFISEAHLYSHFISAEILNGRYGIEVN